MKILLISPVPLFPATGGNRARITAMATVLRGLGHQVEFAYMPNRQVFEYDEQAHREFFGDDGFHPLKRTRTSDALYYGRRAALMAARATRRAFGAAPERLTHVDETFYEPFLGQLRTLHQARRYDAAVVSYVYFSRALLAFPDALRVLDMHDSFTLHLPISAGIRGMRRASVVLAIQEQEAAEFRGLLGKDKKRVRTVGHFIAPSPPLDLTDCAGASFLGSSFAANASSLRWFTESVLPLILREEPAFKLMVGGAASDDIDDHPAVVKLGRVAEARSAFVAGPISLNPISAGTGIKIKLLESMAMGLPVVSTALGVRGVNAERLRGVLVAPDGDAAAFAAAVLKLYRSADLRAQLGARNARAARAWGDETAAALRDLFGGSASSRPAQKVPAAPPVPTTPIPAAQTPVATRAPARA